MDYQMPPLSHPASNVTLVEYFKDARGRWVWDTNGCLSQKLAVDKGTMALVGLTDSPSMQRKFSEYGIRMTAESLDAAPPGTYMQIRSGSIIHEKREPIDLTKKHVVFQCW